MTMNCVRVIKIKFLIVIVNTNAITQVIRIYKTIVSYKQDNQARHVNLCSPTSCDIGLCPIELGK